VEFALQSRRVLIITSSFPPDGEVGGRRLARFAQYLPSFGIEPTILTKTVPDPPPDDFPDFLANTQVVRVQSSRDLLKSLISIKRFTHSVVRSSRKDHVEPAERVGSVEDDSVWENLKHLVHNPDETVSWRRTARRQAMELVRQLRPGAILSSAPSWTNHLIALDVHRKSGVPWVADFRDPWTFNPWNQHDPDWKRRMSKRWEALVFRHAALIICNTEPMRALYEEAYSFARDKLVVLTNGFEPVVPPDVLSGQRKRLAHVGDLYDGRDISSFCVAMQSLLNEGVIRECDVEVSFLGDVPDEMVSRAVQRTPELFATGVIKIRKRVPWQEAQNIMWAADVLLLFQGAYRTQIPAKFFEYLSTGKPLLAIAEPGALSQAIDSTHSGLTALPSDTGQIAKQISEILQWSAKSKEDLEDSAKLFQWREIVFKLAQLLKERVAI
jgi:glycosyltransferase involved in cell wall biosynthesis